MSKPTRGPKNGGQSQSDPRPTRPENCPGEVLPGESTQRQKKKPYWRSNGEWAVIRAEYENGRESLDGLAKRLRVAPSTMRKRAADEKWQRRSAIAERMGTAIVEAADAAIVAEAEKHGKAIAQKLAKDLAPWIEEQKRSHLRASVKRSKRALRRIDRIGANGYEVYDTKAEGLVKCEVSPRDEQSLAIASEKHDSIIRRNLGMGEQSSIGGSISLRVLNGAVAIEATVESPK